jgi:putative efflux protein, MATE family
MEKQEKLFSRKDLFLLFIPLIIEKALEFLVGIVDSMTASLIGESAISGISLVDSIMTLLISLFAALATGGSVVAGQYLGNKNEKQANKIANQLVWFVGIISIVLMAVVYLIKPVFLNGLFGEISDAVRLEANIYFMIVSASIPFIALYNCGAAIFRTMGDSKIPMKIMLLMNGLNALGDIVLVKYFQLGTVGIALPTLLTRIVSAVWVLLLLTKEKYNLKLIKSWKHHFDYQAIQKICSIGVPYGLENGLFFFGRLLVMSLVSTFGTASISANSVGFHLSNIHLLPGLAMNLGFTVIVAKCIGAGDYEQTEYYINKVTKIIYVALFVTCGSVCLLLSPILNVYHLSSEAMQMVKIINYSHVLMTIIVWPLGFALPTALRATGDAKFPMYVNILSMFVCRIGLAYIFAYLGFGMLGTWFAMFVDWIIKAIVFSVRYKKGLWKKYSIID